LIDCAVETPRGEAIGRVTGVEGDAAGSRLIVESRSGEVLVPLAEGIVVTVDVAGQKIVVEPPGGLLDLNVPKRNRLFK
jgi:16S rRNA processing protein RimM